MIETLGDLPYVEIYIDDLLIFSPSREDHIIHLEAVFKRLTAANITINSEKSTFGSTQVKFIGQYVTGSENVPVTLH